MVALVGLDFHPLNLLIGETSLSCSSSSDDDNVETVVSNSTTKSCVFDSVCDELLFEILHRLPLKQIHLCKCLSKRWLVLLSSTRFITQCYARYHQTLVDPSSSFALFYQYRHNEFGIISPEHMGVHLMTLSNSVLFKSPGFSLSFLPNNPKEPIRILAVSNGLLLCCAIFMFHSQYYVCNPLTKHWVALPPPPSSGCKKFVRIGFICRTTTTTLDSENFSTSSSFRVVRVRVPPTSSAAIRLELFSSETWQWTEIVPSELIHKRELRKSLFCPLHSNAIVCNGILHWHSFLGKIFAYDVYKSDDGCCYQIMSLPKHRNTRAHDFYFGETQGRLRYIEFVYSTVRMWSVEDYNKGEWCLLKKFRIDQMVSEDPWVTNYINWPVPMLQSLAFHPFDEHIFFMSFPGRIILCNMQTNTLEPVCDLVPKSDLYSCMIFPFVLPCWPTPVSNHVNRSSCN